MGGLRVLWGDTRAKTSIAQELPKDLENKISEFRRQVKYVRENGDFPYQVIGNMDETPVYMDMVPSKTVDHKNQDNEVWKMPSNSYSGMYGYWRYATTYDNIQGHYT